MEKEITGGIEKIFNPSIEEIGEETFNLINEMLTILTENSFEDAAKKIVPLSHVTLLNKEEDALAANIMMFNLKNAHQNAKNYKNPAEITEIRRMLKIKSVGCSVACDEGFLHRYFIARKEDSEGKSAPVSVFFSKLTNKPLIIDFGSL